jgi:hypothetical protein
MTLDEWVLVAQEQSGEERNRVARDELPGDIQVSTVFLGLDHQRYPGGPPLIFETMIFGGKWDGYQWRYSTEARALDAHVAIVAACREGTDPTEAVPS